MANIGGDSASVTKKSPQLTNKFKLRVVGGATASGVANSTSSNTVTVPVTGATSDSDASLETNSLSAESTTDHQQQHNASITYISKNQNKINSSYNISTNNSSSNSNAAAQIEKRRKKASAAPRRGSEWEIMEGLKDGQRFENKPNPYSGFLHKKRKWPLKGWHKRYFVIDKGILVYGKGPSEISKGKVHGSVDIGLSVITTKDKRKRIDIDAEEFIYHLKAKTEEAFANWVQQLTAHRLYRQHVLTYGTNIGGSLFKPTVDGLHNLPRTPEILSRDGSLTRGIPPLPSSGPGGGRLGVWLQESQNSLEQYQRDLSDIEQNVTMMNRLLRQIESSAISYTESINEALSPNIKKDRRKFGLKKKKSSKGSSVDLTIQFSAANKSAGTDADNISPLSTNSFSALSTPPGQLIGANNSAICTSSSTTNAITLPLPQQQQQTIATTPTPDSLSNVDVISLSTDNQLRDDFVSLAKTVLSNLKTLTFGLSTERERLKTALESEGNNTSGGAVNQNVMASLRNNLNQALQQNSELKSRLLRIHEASDVTDISSLDQLSEQQRPYNASLSLSSSCVSATEFFDAEDLPLQSPGTGGGTSSPSNYQQQQQQEKVLISNSATCGEDIYVQEEESEVRTRSESSSEEEEEEEEEMGSLSSGDQDGSISSESEIGTELIAGHHHHHNSTRHHHHQASNALELVGSQSLTGRRTILPCPRPHTEGLSLWNLLSRNIGKDLSQISMPVALNEPLNVLQRLCEELEYSELLDKAAGIEDPYLRMVHVAAFAVSAYASTFSRAGNKPFNPLLGETFECTREDKGFKFLAEQVSHHPPVSACYAKSNNFTFWQDARVKAKFWGKSMEFQPLGSVHVFLPKTGDLYTWNKVTTCVHNLFSGQRWVDQYGELKVSNGRITCKLTFSKASYWSAKRHEVVGAVYDENNKPVHRLFGKWSESLYCGVPPAAKCVWRAGTLPPDHELYYGFTRFAIELNELRPEDAHLLPPTDSRFRPDQRALEEGDVAKAEALKSQLEMAQRNIPVSLKYSESAISKIRPRIAKMRLTDLNRFCDHALKYLRWDVLKKSTGKNLFQPVLFFKTWERRKRREELGVQYEPRWFSSSAQLPQQQKKEDDTWEYNGKYWETRKNPGFANMQFESLW